MLGQHPEQSNPTSAKSGRETADVGAKFPTPPRAPRRKDGPALLAHYLATARWLEMEVHADLHGEDAIDRGADYLNRAFDRLSQAPCRTRADALAKLKLLQADDDAQGGYLVDEVKRPIIDQVVAFLEAQSDEPREA